MRTKIEGIVLAKSPFRERDLICRLLLRNGKQVSVLFYGGRGGGRKMKSSLVELGHLLVLELNRFRRNHRGMYSTREYTLGWHHSRLRHNHQAFYLLCFYLELISQMAQEDELAQRDFEGEGQHGLFRVLSNAIYYLEEAVSKGEEWDKDRHLASFLSKLIIELGITPNLEHCLYSNRALSQVKDFQLLFDQGGFVDGQYLTGPTVNHRGVWEILGQSWRLSYPEVAGLERRESQHIQALYHYLLFQTQIISEKIKTATLVI